ncbi:MAG: hypothetical protein JSU76_03585 [Dehalococcoidia bacterium]|nr:MAG: hypothetical protein JSU76_03585 [Dehalococcoidia bacterium]
MTRLWQSIMRGERGQALPAVLMLLVLGGLIIVPALNYTSTSLNAGQVVEENVKGGYAAEAGVEHVLWSMKNGAAVLLEQLPEDVNQMQVSMQTQELGNYALYNGQLGLTGVHYDYLAIDKQLIWKEEAGAYEYTIIITWQAPIGDPPIILEEVGAALPLGYAYKPNSAANFPENLSTAEPDDALNGNGTHMLNWALGAPFPMISEGDPVKTQTFYITGEGDTGSSYVWIVAAREDVSIVSGTVGTLYRITATATQPEDGEITAEITADVMVNEAGEAIDIVLWQVNP